MLYPSPCASPTTPLRAFMRLVWHLLWGAAFCAGFMSLGVFSAGRVRVPPSPPSLSLALLLSLSLCICSSVYPSSRPLLNTSAHQSIYLSDSLSRAQVSFIIRAAVFSAKKRFVLLPNLFIPSLPRAHKLAGAHRSHGGGRSCAGLCAPVFECSQSL